jgi:hypothetical protein
MKPFNGRIKVMLELNYMKVTREEVIEIQTEEILELGGLRTMLSAYQVGQAWSKEHREKYLKLVNARADFAKAIADEVASAIIAALECSDHPRVQVTDQELKHEDDDE